MAIATATALTELEWLTSPALERLFEKSVSLLGSDYGKDLEDLDTSLLPQIQRTIQAPQNSPHKAQHARWFKRLKEVYYDAEDTLDELQYELLSRKVERKNVREDRKLWVRVSPKPVIKPLAKFANPAVKRYSLLSPLKKKLLDRLKKLKEIAAEAKTFHDLLGIQNTESNDAILTGNSSSVTSSFLIDKVFGRDGDRDEIINFLLDKQGGSSLYNRYLVVAVTGMGGVGKTTLVQYVYNDERVENHFRVRMWLCLSQKFDAIDRIKEMIECASEKECPNLSSLDVLQDKLIETLPKSEKIMVVLDDVWYDNNDQEGGENKLNNLVQPLIKFASQGGTCKIVVTSRSASFPSALQPGKLIELSNLAPNDSIPLLRYHAIDGLQINDPQLKNDLSDIVDQLRLPVPLAPLAAKVVGNQLRERPDIKFWQATLKNVNFSTDDVIAIKHSLRYSKVFGRDVVNFVRNRNYVNGRRGVPYFMDHLANRNDDYYPGFRNWMDHLAIRNDDYHPRVCNFMDHLVNRNAFVDIDFNDTECPFRLVEDSQEKASLKPNPLELKHEVQCLKHVNAFHASLLQKNNIKTVKDFLKSYYNDEPALRMILGIMSESDESWKSMVEHAMQCSIDYHTKYNNFNNTSQCVQVVLKLPFMIDEFQKQRAMNAVAYIEGISKQVDPEAQKMTIIGHMGIVKYAVKLLSDVGTVYIVSVGPAKEDEESAFLARARSSLVKGLATPTWLDF